MPGTIINSKGRYAYYWNFTTTKMTPNFLIYLVLKKDRKWVFDHPTFLKGIQAGLTLEQVESTFKKLAEVKIINYKTVLISPNTMSNTTRYFKRLNPSKEFIEMLYKLSDNILQYYGEQRGWHYSFSFGDSVETREALLASDRMIEVTEEEMNQLIKERRID